MTGVFVRTEDEDTDRQTDEHVRTQGEDGACEPRSKASGEPSSPLASTSSPKDRNTLLV